MDLIKLPEADRVDLRVGNCLDVLKELPDGRFHTCVTSPPYFGLRDYGHDDQIGMEQTPDDYVAKMVEVFREVRRTLRDDGTLWLNLGDSYLSTAGRMRPLRAKGKSYDKINGDDADGLAKNSSSSLASTWGNGVKPKDLIGIPWRVAFALQADGWYLRQDIIWSKPNPMPESVRDRCTKSHEYIFLLSKSEKYHFDHHAILEEATTNAAHKHWTERDYDQSMLANKQKTGVKGRPTGVAGYAAPGKRNKRSVWTVSPKPFSGAHFAVYPPELIEPCILAGSPKDGHVLDPFGGSGTTGLVAADLGRHATLIELNPEYGEIIRSRLEHRLKN